ncbi:MAG: 4Fe-4S dicluster domain-containing protein [Rubrivivax sp.]|nr:4Fe-4S dicluster domain-containing protein [Rubrivivax sp.]
MTRRQAMSLMAASLALANGACSAPPNELIVPYVDLPEAGTAGVPVYYASALVRDGHAHGVLVGTREGRPIKIEGNPTHPSSLGATDAFAQASVLQLWDPDRSAAVRERLGVPRAGAPAAAAASSWSAFETMWRAQAPRLRGAGGERLRLLLGPTSSPTERRLLEALQERFPRMRVHLHDPLHDGAASRAMRSAFGRELAPVLHLDRARCVLALAADPFSDGPGAVRAALDWASARAAARDGRSLPRLFAAEVSSGLFGARAERRVALPPALIEALLRRVAAPWLGTEGGMSSPGDPFEREVLQALRQAGPDALVIAGRGLSADAHGLVLALNQRLGAYGRTLDLIDAPTALPQAGTLSELVQALEGGAVDTLVIVGANPAYDAPAALGVPAALAKAHTTVHAGLHVDETAVLCDWHLPLSHDYERWGDARGHDGSATILQPAIAPLYDSRSDIELLALLAGADERAGHALVQGHWRERFGGNAADADAAWRDSLRRGVVADSASTPVAVRELPVRELPVRELPVRALPMPAQPGAATAPLVAVFAPDPAVHDGRFANLGWLQELPRPFSKITWDNALQIGPRTAAEHGLSSGDIVTARIGAQAVQAPVWVDARHAEAVVTLPLGYGRRHAGRVGNGVGFDAYAVRPAVDGAPPAVTLERRGRRHAFALTQHSIDPQDRALARTVEAGGRIDRPDTVHASLYPAYTDPGRAWAMVIDLDACIGCNACTIACQAENNIPVVGREQVELGREMHWIRVDRYESPDLHNTVFQPVPCMQCEKAPCELVCPVGATVHDSEGINVQVYNRCIGTRFCSNNCPYKVRRFNFLQYSDTDTETLKGQRNPDVTVRQRGVMEKCNYCLQRLTRARHHVETGGAPLRDGDVVTACQAVCQTRAIRFGDLNDAASDVRRAKDSPRHYALLGELNTQPRTTYLARVRP